MSMSELWTPMQQRRLSRRQMLNTSAKAGVGAAGLALVGCGDDDDDGAPAAAAPAESAAQPAAFSWKICPSFEAPFAGLYSWIYVAEALGYFEQERDGGDEPHR